MDFSMDSVKPGVEIAIGGALLHIGAVGNLISKVPGGKVGGAIAAVIAGVLAKQYSEDLANVLFGLAAAIAGDPPLTLGTNMSNRYPDGRLVVS